MDFWEVFFMNVLRLLSEFYCLFAKDTSTCRTDLPPLQPNSKDLIV